MEYRDENAGVLKSAGEKVPRLGPSAGQCAGFMRIANGKNPLDASGVHPEAYPQLIEKSYKLPRNLFKDLMGNAGCGTSTMRNNSLMNNLVYRPFKIFSKELGKPGRDPRGEFKTAVLL